MTTRQSTVDHILEQIALDQIAPTHAVARKMFGEFAIYVSGVLVALVCDDTLFLKLTAGGRAIAGDVVEAPPYPGAKPCLVIPADRLDEAEWLTALVRITAAELPPPKQKRIRPPAARAGRE